MKKVSAAHTLKEDLDFVEGLLTDMGSRFPPHPLGAVVKQLIEVGGKRVRPLLVVLSFRCLDEERDISYAAPIAAAVELIHTATLIHDDIIDKSSKRRGVETAYKKWGEEAAILAGDLLFSKAFGLVGVHEINELTEVISETCISLTEGEMLEYRHTWNTSITEEVYLEIIERKTAKLFEACTKSGALLAGATSEDVGAFVRFGGYLGTSFQIVDDVLDITAGHKFGKPRGIDIREGKVTIAAIHALKHAPLEDRKILGSIIRRKRKSAADIERASEIIKESGSIEYAFERAAHFSKMARQQLKGLPDTLAKKRLLEMTDEVINRPF